MGNLYAQPITPKRKPRVEKVCKYCDGPFSTRRKDRLYCSDRCRFHDWKQRKESEQEAPDDRLRRIIREEIEKVLTARDAGR